MNQKQEELPWTIVQKLSIPPKNSVTESPLFDDITTINAKLKSVIQKRRLVVCRFLQVFFSLRDELSIKMGFIGRLRSRRGPQMDTFRARNIMNITTI